MQLPDVIDQPLVPIMVPKARGVHPEYWMLTSSLLSGTPAAGVILRRDNGDIKKQQGANIAFCHIFSYSSSRIRVDGSASIILFFVFGAYPAVSSGSNAPGTTPSVLC